MAIEHDVRGLPVTAADPAAVVALDRAVEAFLGMRVDIGDHMKDAFAADPDMPMALIAKTAFLKMFAAAEMEAAAKKALEAARTRIDQGAATARERAHLEAAAHWVAGDLEAACRAWEALLIDWPRDILAVKLAQLNRFYLGEPGWMRAGIARTLDAWDENVPGYGYLIGSYAFALEECGDYPAAERRGRAAIEIEPRDIWAAHAVAHVHEMEGRAKEGLDWLDGLKAHWAECHNFKHHAHWHRGLFALDLGRYDDVLALYDRDIWTEIAGDYLDISNAVSLLWRLEEEGIDVGARWQPIAALAAERAGEHALVFATCHFGMALAATGRRADLSELIAAQETHAAAADDTYARVWRAVGRSLVEAAAAQAEGDAGRAADLLLDVRGAIRQIGGSHAQRDLFERMIVTAALADGRLRTARALLAERRALRPTHRWNWSRTAEALRGLGDDPGADRAEREAAALLG